MGAFLVVFGVPGLLFLANVLAGYRNPLPPTAPSCPQDAANLSEAIGAAAGAVWGLAALCWAILGVAVFLSPLAALAWLVLR